MARTSAPERVDVVVVTGASAGVGRAVAIEFAKSKAKLGLIARSGSALAEVKAEVERNGGEALVLTVDVADAEQVELAARAVEVKLGPIDVWVNCAMVSVFSPVKEMFAEEFRRVTEVTYLGYVHGTLAALKRMLPRDKGVIVQIGSALAYRSIPLQSAYCAAKHAIAGFSESLRVELIHDHSAMHVVQVDLPAVNTPQFRWVKSRLPNKAKPVPPIYQPELIAQGVVWAARHPRKRMTIGFQAWLAINVEKFFSSLADRYLARNGYRSQQTDEPEDPTRPNNLWRPVTGLHSTRGDFSENARTSSLLLRWHMHGRRILTLSGILIAAVLLKPRLQSVRRTRRIDHGAEEEAA